jgi:hypothetical protein
MSKLLLLLALAAQDDPLEGLRKEHPRLLMTDARLGELKTLHKGDTLLQRYVKDTLDGADHFVKARTLRYEIPDGLRLLRVSRECLQRTATLGFAYRWTGERRYLDAALRDLRAVCAFKDWNPRHFLDTAEMSNAVGLGLDWFHGDLDEKTRKTLRDSLLRLGLEPGLERYKGRKSWVRSQNNWNQVCNSGLIVGALAVAETHPDVAKTIISSALKSLPTAMRHYAPHGAWMEGPSYWNYATSYTCYGIAALDTALGKDLGISAYPGFSASGHFPVYTTGPTGFYLSFADARMVSRRGPLAPLFFLARKFDTPEFSDSEHETLRNNRANVLHVIWYRPPSGRSWTRDLDRYFAGPVEVVSMRTTWKDPDALWVGAKAGFNNVPHGHLDLGNFELDALGKRWAVDPGKDNYNLPGYWDRKEGGKRWTYYRLNSLSHNVPTLDGKSQLVSGKAKVLRWHSTKDEAAAVIDLKTAYRNVDRAVRGVRLYRPLNAALVQDELELKGSRDLTWGMTTQADIRVEKDGSALLTLGDKKMTLVVLSPKGARFEQAPAKDLRGMKRLLLEFKQVSGTQRLAVLFVPGKERLPKIAVEPIDQWPGKPPRSTP